MVDVEILLGEGKVVEILGPDFLELLPGSELIIDIDDQYTEVVELIEAGPQGLSAYELALQNGFTGTEQDWLASLGGTDEFFKRYFEYFSKNLQSYPATLNYSGGKLVSIVYQTSPSTEVTKTLSYTGTKLISITLSGDLPSTLVLRTKTLNYTGEDLTSYVYS